MMMMMIIIITVCHCNCESMYSVIMVLCCYLSSIVICLLLELLTFSVKSERDGCKFFHLNYE